MKNLNLFLRLGCLCLIAWLILSCADKQTPPLPGVWQINIPLTDKDTPLSPDSLFCGKEIVPLETTAESVIQQIDKLEIVNDTLYILDKDQEIIFLFDKTGKYIAKIDDKGRAGEEYLYMTDFHIDDDILYVPDEGACKVLCYNLQGRFLFSFPTVSSAYNVTAYSNYIYLFHNFSTDTNYNESVYNKNDHTFHKQYKSFPPQRAGWCSHHRAWTNCGNEVYASFPDEYNIYCLTPDTCTVVSTINYGEEYMFPENWNTYSLQEHDDYLKKHGWPTNCSLVPDCKNLFITPQRLIFSFTHKHHSYLALVDRHTKAIRWGMVGSNSPADYYWATYQLDPIYTSDQYLVDYESAYFILEQREYHGKIPEFAKEWELNLQEDDNPCLYFYKFKD